MFAFPNGLTSSPYRVAAIAVDLLLRERLTEHLGETETSLQRLRGPIGIFIGSKSPAEIAVSVMVEVLTAKNGISLPDDMSIAEAKRSMESPALEETAYDLRLTPPSYALARLLSVFFISSGQKKQKQKAMPTNSALSPNFKGQATGRTPRQLCRV